MYLYLFYIWWIIEWCSYLDFLIRINRKWSCECNWSTSFSSAQMGDTMTRFLPMLSVSVPLTSWQAFDDKILWNFVYWKIQNVCSFAINNKVLFTHVAIRWRWQYSKIQDQTETMAFKMGDIFKRDYK